MSVTAVWVALSVWAAGSGLALGATTAGCPQVVDIDWHVYNGSCYWVSTYRDSWREARTACHTMAAAADLAAIHDLVENAWIKELSADRDLWLGLNDIADEGQFVWATGETVDFLFWERGQPDNLLLKQDCVHMVQGLATGQWDDEDCAEEKHFLCKTAVTPA